MPVYNFRLPNIRIEYQCKPKQVDLNGFLFEPCIIIIIRGCKLFVIQDIQTMDLDYARSKFRI